MRLIVIRDVGEDDRGAGSLRHGLGMSPLADALLRGMHHLWCCGQSGRAPECAEPMVPHDTVWAIPKHWQARCMAHSDRVVFYGNSREVRVDAIAPRCESWAIISNGRFATSVNGRLLQEVLAETHADIVAVTASPDLLAYREQARLTQDGRLAGLRRYYADSVVPTPMPAEWPHHLLIRRESLDRVRNADLVGCFSEFLAKCRHAGLTGEAISIAGGSLDLDTKEGILTLGESALGEPGAAAASALRSTQSTRREGISPQARVIGPVLFGDRVVVEAEAVIVGPAILCDDSRVERGALVDTSIVGENVSVESGRVLQHEVVLGLQSEPERTEADTTAQASRSCARGGSEEMFRTWPRLSYVGCVKRGVDIVAAALVLVLFLPVLPLLALAVKVSSPGPVFFRHRRQGLHGETFGCIKFRTMKAGSDEIQDKLRFVCEVDGPQFKMTDDPRITGVGQFLRETYLDEIPQFFNVLCGHMSVVGPRPSPESENTLCAAWRDARLSVRPGITGLWQVYRTREPFKDFQEWIHYDMRYVRELSARQDLWICWLTFRRMVLTFIRQF